MKKKFVLAIAILGLTNGAFACIGGNQAKLTGNGATMATLDKYENKITLAEGTSLVYIGNCQADNIDADLTARVVDISSYVEEQSDVCIGLATSQMRKRFRLSWTMLTTMSKDISPSCGGEVVGID